MGRGSGWGRFEEEEAAFGCVVGLKGFTTATGPLHLLPGLGSPSPSDDEKCRVVSWGAYRWGGSVEEGQQVVSGVNPAVAARGKGAVALGKGVAASETGVVALGTSAFALIKGVVALGKGAMA